MKMSASVELLEARETRGLSLVKPLDEAVGQAWAANNRAQDQRNNAAFLKGVRFIVAAGAMVAMFQAFHTRQFVLAGLFAALVALYNPVAPVLSFSGDWQRAVVVASALPFIVSLRSAHLKDGTQ
jgi:predicted membrane protein